MPVNHQSNLSTQVDGTHLPPINRIQHPTIVLVHREVVKVIMWGADRRADGLVEGIGVNAAGEGVTIFESAC